ncbi:unnamed protein product, partial [Rotaria sp. Silwood1]
ERNKWSPKQPDQNNPTIHWEKFRVVI